MRRIRATSLWLAAAVLAAQSPTAAQGAKAVGKSAAVAAEHRLASEAGLEILHAGGNAVDAAVAALLVGGVVNPSSSGLGGGGFMLVFLAQDRSLHAIDFRESAPAASHRDMFVRDGRVDEIASQRGGLAVAIPTEARGFEYALSRFGTLPLAVVAEPAIRLARDGFRVEPHLANALERYHGEIAADADLARDLLKANGQPYREGETLRRTDLAATLSELVRAGANSFFSGEIGIAIAEKIRTAGGIVSPEDLRSYRVIERQPIVTRYRNATIVGMPPPSSGGGSIAAALNVLEGFRLTDLGSGGTTYVHLLAETLKAVFADRARYYGDPDFTDVPLARLTSQSHATSLRHRLRASRAIPSSEYGTNQPANDAGTAHVSVIDSMGNAVATTSSINTAFGAKLGVRGLILNNTMDDFSLQPGTPNAYGLIGNAANAIEPGKRPLSSMSPTLVLDRDQVTMATGGSGGPFIISATLQSILNTMDFGLDADASIAAPRIHHQWLPDFLLIEPGQAELLVPSLERLGHHVRTMPGIAAVSAITRTRSPGRSTELVAGTDDRKGGVPAAY